MKFIYGIFLLICFSLNAQPKNDSNPFNYVKKGDLIVVTNYHENGVIAQTGFIKNGELHGKWTSYDLNGNEKMIGYYQNGKKNGKWFIWSYGNLKEVNFKNNKVVSYLDCGSKKEIASIQ